MIAIDSIRYRLGEPDDAARFCDLFNSLYARKVTADYYRWQFFDTPFPGYLQMAFDPDGGLVGCYGVQLRETTTHAVNLAWALDIMIAPEYQGRGLFRRLAASALAHADAAAAGVCVLANARARAAHVDGLGWEEIQRVPAWTRSTEALPLAAGRLHFVPFDLFTPDMAPDLEEMQRDRAGMAATRRTVDSLNWRFARNPWHRYELFQAMQQAQRVGFLALKMFRDPVSGRLSGDLVEILWRPDQEDAIAEMLTFAARHLGAEGAPDVTAWLPNQASARAAARFGFTMTRPERYLCCASRGDRADWFSDASAWVLTMADSEVF